VQKQNSAEEYITFLRLFSESTNITFTTIVHNNKFGYVYNLTTLCVEGASESEATCTCAHRCVGVRSPVQVHMLGQRPQYGVQSYGKYSRVRCFCLYFARAPIHIGSCAYLTRFEWKAGGQYSGQSAAVPKVPSFTSRTSGLCLCWFPHLGPCFSPLTPLCAALPQPSQTPAPMGRHMALGLPCRRRKAWASGSILSRAMGLVCRTPD